MSNADPTNRVLWAVAEAGGRFSPAAPEAEQRQAWAAIEQAVAAARRHFEQLIDSAGDQAELHVAMAGRAEADAARARAESERDEALAALEGAKASRDVALATLSRAESQRDSALAAITHAETALAEVAAQRDKALAELLAVAGGRPTIIDVRAVAHDDDDDADADDDDDEIVLTDPPALGAGDDAFVTEWRPEPSEPPPPSRAPLEGPVVYLQVGATFANLLPDNLGTLLVTDARLIRQEGRLAAVLALPSGPNGSPTPAGQAQADRLQEAGYRVEWSKGYHLAS